MSSTVTVVPWSCRPMSSSPDRLSSWRQRRVALALPCFRPETEIDGEVTRVLVEQVGAVDTQRLGDLAGHLTREEIWGVDEAPNAVLGLR